MSDHWARNEDVSDEGNGSNGNPTENSASQDDSDDDGADLTSDELRDGIKDALDAIRSTGDFSCAALPQRFVDPQLCIGSVTTPIRLPLRAEDAEAIIASSRPAPFGLGSETIVDMTVRKTFEVNPDQITMLNGGAFNSMLVHEIIPFIAREMGLPDMIDAELYKLLLYEKGAHFKPHKDTEKAPGMFGTLAICLPCKHTGGDLVLSHHGISKVFSSAARNPMYAAWYSDVLHEVREVTSGYRLVLTYNLVHRQAGMGTALTTWTASSMHHHQPLSRAVKQWVREDHERHDPPAELIYRLEHKYTDASIGMHRLKANDLARAMALNALAQKRGFVMYLASMEREIYGGVDEDPDEYSDFDPYREEESGEDESGEEPDGSRAANRFSGLDYHPIVDTILDSLLLKRVVETSGLELARDLPIEQEWIVGDDQLDGEPDDEDYSGFTGNEGTSATHWYRDTVIVLVPRARSVPFLLSHYLSPEGKNNDILPFVNRYFDAAKENSRDEDSRTDLKAICRSVVKAQSGRKDPPRFSMLGIDRPRFNDTVASRIVEALIWLGDWRLLRIAVESYVGEVPPTVTSALAPLIDSFSVDGVGHIFDAAILGCVRPSKQFLALKSVLGKDAYSILRSGKQPASE